MTPQQLSAGLAVLRRVVRADVLMGDMSAAAQENLVREIGRAVVGTSPPAKPQPLLPPQPEPDHTLRTRVLAVVPADAGDAARGEVLIASGVDLDSLAAKYGINRERT